MREKMNELAVMNSLIDKEKELLKKLEERIFLQQLRLASLKATRDRIMRQEILPDDE